VRYVKKCKVGRAHVRLGLEFDMRNGRFTMWRRSIVLPCALLALGPAGLPQENAAGITGGTAVLARQAPGTRLGDMAERVGAGIAELLCVGGCAQAEGVQNTDNRAHVKGSNKLAFQRTDLSRRTETVIPRREIGSGRPNGK